ncbi:type I-E CRISPR-associated protein Cas5/CasD [Ruegeria sp. PrR005]|uniref:Type I-E CRISPR-associated protein Cas5/CasD n=1 Tax=Ruegeria sp. PrR005 TaxID=2706882 RepID=A0A6B2NUF4_9RHOB|nr:type I-E CRISPR-associated protein Cas5/CasD [Ruegeria sp. PrR005]NDW46343.1 type I-E CRISPR-associated protein Cas5/CasD [Ruegeria sp. PrR005]
MTQRWLHLRLSAPLMAFGGVLIDQVGPTRDFPSASALTGLLANALGWQREDGAAHQSLQDRMEFGALIAREGRLVTDNQNARVYEEEPGWTTYAQPETRNKGSTYSNAPLAAQQGNQAGRKWLTHRRRRDYLADHDCRVVLRLAAGDGPDLETLAAALDRPARPLFIGRKPCLPSAPLFAGWVEGEDARAALVALALPGRALWPSSGDEPGYDMPDLRHWVSGLHGGSRWVCEGMLP